MKREIVFVMDVDGCMTTGMVSYPSGERKFSVRDGHGISSLWWGNNNIYPLVMSGESDDSIRARMEKLGVISFHGGVKNKYKELRENISWRGNKGYNGDYIAISDDIPDIQLLENAIIAFCPNDAEPEVIQTIKNHPHGYVLSRKGGQHCVREAINYLLKNSYLHEKFGIKVFEQTE